MNRDLIKYLAMLTMLLNHVAHVFLPHDSLQGQVMISVGYFTAPVMCFFLVEGYYYTTSVKKYESRMLLFALLSQIPYMLIFQKRGLSIFATLFVGLQILKIKDMEAECWKKATAYLLLIGVTYFMDWSIFAVGLVLLLAYAWGNKKEMLRSFVILMLVEAFSKMPEQEPETWLLFLENYGIGLCRSLAILFAGVVVIYLYNGKRSRFAPNFFKWFFYAFYPAHMLILYMIKQIMTS